MLVDKDGKMEHSKNESETEEPGFPTSQQKINNRIMRKM